MPQYTPPIRDIDFVLFDVLGAQRIWQRISAFKELSREFVSTLLEEASKVLVNEWLPLNREGDEQGARYANGVVTVPPGFKAAYDAWAQAGWIGLSGDTAFGGQGMPRSMTVGVDEMLFASNTSLNLYITLTIGASVLLEAHADEAIKARYLPKLYSGEWSGVMALTEAQAGTDLGLITTRAQPRSDGTYGITGTKIFITSGEHDMTSNIVHLVLAKLPDAPAGSGGISLFLVPKFLPKEDGSAGARNHVMSLGIEAKMGIHGSPTNVMRYEDAAGHLIGEPHKGLACMFTMMNHERLAIGMQGLGLAEIAYQNARAYAAQRVQGTAEGRRGGPAHSIVAHPDVRRMLLLQRALNEGGRAFAMLVGMYLDVAKCADDPIERASAERFVALFTPVAKAFFTDRGYEGCVLAQQVLGGHGYIREWGIEQYVRDARIAQIYEGTNGVQALDLLGRKVVRDGARTLTEWLLEVRKDAGTAPERFRARLIDAVTTLETVSSELLKGAPADANLVGSAASEYLDLFGYVAYAWLWAKMARVAEAKIAANPDADNFCADKKALADFYFAKVLPRIHSLAASIRNGSSALMALSDDRV